MTDNNLELTLPLALNIIEGMKYAASIGENRIRELKSENDKLRVILADVLEVLTKLELHEDESAARAALEKKND